MEMILKNNLKSQSHIQSSIASNSNHPLTIESSQSDRQNILAKLAIHLTSVPRSGQHNNDSIFIGNPSIAVKLTAEL